MTTKNHPAPFTLLLAGLLASVLASCTRPQMARYDEYLNTWIGIPSRQLTRVWGAPQHVEMLADGSTLLEYRERNVERFTVPVTGGSTAVGGVRVENRVSWCVTRFTARNGLIESARFEGTACTAP